MGKGKNNKQTNNLSPKNNRNETPKQTTCGHCSDVPGCKFDRPAKGKIVSLATASVTYLREDLN